MESDRIWLLRILAIVVRMERLPSLLSSSLTTPSLTPAVLGKRDLKSGFHHILLKESARQYMGFEHPRKPGLFWPMGGPALWRGTVSCHVLQNDIISSRYI